MELSLLNSREDEPRLKVSIPIRLIAVVSCLLPVLGVVLSSKFLLEMFVNLSKDESAGAVEVMEVVTGASSFVTGSLYLAIVCGLVVIVVLVRRFIIQPKTAAPSIWFFAVIGILYLVPAGIYRKAYLLILEAINPNSSIPAGEIAGTGAYIAELLVLSVAAAAIVSVLMVVAAVVPLSSRSNSTRISLIGAMAIEILLIGSAFILPV